MVPRARYAAALGLITAALAVVGCAPTSPWANSYVPDRVLSSSLGMAPLDPKTAPVQIRSIPWARMEMAMGEWEREATRSDVHPEDWDAAKKESVKAILLRGLQVSVDPSSIAVVGRTGFKTTDSLHPDSPADREELRRFARTVGANQVIWASKYVGKTDAIVQESVTSYTTGTESRDDRSDRHHRQEPFNQSTTTWVPIRIQKDETAFVAVFLRS